jgi:predicted dehydrogenase
LILNEKPMAEPHRPETCRRLVEAADASRAVMLYDFPELFDPLTERVLGHLEQFRDVRLTGLSVQRSKDREDPGNPRNEKRMVPIQYQETVHCLAFALYLLAALKGGVANCLDGGVTVEGESEPYRPPNPEAYPYVVDGRCRYAMTLAGVRVEGLTDFKRGAEWAKRRVIRGVGDGEPFEIDVSFLEGKKHLRINGEDRSCDPNGSSYEHILATAFRWSREVDRTRLMSGLYPNPRFTRVTYQLSSALWRSCRDRGAVAFGSAADLDGWDAGFAAELPRLGRYGTGA